MRRGTLILLFCNYVAALPAWGGKGVVKVILNHQNWSRDRSFSWLRHKNWKKLWDRMIRQIWSHKLGKKLISCMTKRYLGNCKINSRKSLFFSLLRLPPWGALRYLYRKNITNFHLLKTKTAHRFMKHRNEHSKREKWVCIARSKN